MLISFMKYLYRLMELDREARKHAERQKQRVLEELWAMEGEHHIKIKQVLSRPKSSSEVYESKSKSSKYDHLTNPSREKSKFHDRCDDSDFRPEKQAWVPEEIRNRVTKDDAQLKKEKEYRDKHDHLMNATREPSKYHTKCEDTDYRPEKTVWIPEEVRRSRVKDEAQLQREKEYRDKHNHLMHATREQSRYHTKCEDTDYRPERKTWIPEETKKGTTKSEEQLMREKENRAKFDHLMIATREPSRYHTKCDDTDYRPEKKTWIPEETRHGITKSEEQTMREKENRAKFDHLMIATREPSRYHTRCDDTDYRPEKKTWIPEETRHGAERNEEQLRREKENRAKFDHLMIATREPSKYHNKCEDTDYRPERKTWVPDDVRQGITRDERQLLKEKESRAKYDHLMIATREPSKYHEKCDDPDYIPEKKTWVPEDSRHGVVKDEKKLQRDKENRARYDHLMIATREPSKYHEKCDDPDYIPEKKTWVPEEVSRKTAVKDEKQLTKEKEDRAKYDHLMIATREPSKFHEKCDDPDYIPEKKKWIPPEKKDEVHKEGHTEERQPKSPKTSDKYDHLTSPVREKSKYHDKCDDPDWRPEKKTWMPSEKHKEIVLRKLYEMTNTQPATQSKPTIPSEKARTSSVIIIGKGPAGQGDKEDDLDKTWDEILQSNVDPDEKREKPSKSSGKYNAEMDELDLVPDKDWSLSIENSKNGKKTNVEIHQLPEDIKRDNEPDKKERKKKQKSMEKRMSEKNLLLDGEETVENKQRQDETKAKRRQFKGQKSKHTFTSYHDHEDADNEPRDILREFVDMSVDRDIMKEFVNESLERENNIKKAENEAVNQNNNGAISKEAMKQDLVECLDLIERSVSGKIIDANNDNEKHSNKESGEDMDHENDSTNVSITLQDSSSDKKKERTEAKQMDAKTPTKSKSPPPLQGVKKQSSSFTKSDQDIFIELIIDELKRENREIKYTLAAREDKLEHAASRVSEMVVS